LLIIVQIVAAVSAVVSAFHGGSELLRIVKQKRRARKARDQVQQEWQEEQLQASLLAGEQQIDLRYKQDQRELGDYVRVGDGEFHDRGSYSRLDT
jgi:cell division protein FtsL